MTAGRINLLLAGLVVVLVLVLWLSPDPDAEPEREVLTDLKRSSISRISIVHPGAELIVLEKQQGAWRLTAPLTARAEDFQVGNLLELAERRARASYPAAEIELESVGLQPARYELRLDDTALQFGDTDPLNNLRYVRLGERVHLISDLPPATLDASPYDLIDRRPLPPDMEITAIELPGMTLTRTETGGWQVTPESKDQGADAAQALVDAWARARASVVTEIADDAGFTEEYLFHGAGREIRLSRVKESGLVLARRDLGLQYRFSSHMQDELFELQAPDPDDFTDEQQ